MVKNPLRGGKNRLEVLLRESLFGRSCFSPLRNAYQAIFNRGKLRHRQKMRKFYSRFIRSGDLVFDVGANVGIYSEIFSDLGAEVVAVEPNPACCRLLERFARNRRLKIEPCAAGESSGKAFLELNSHHQLSSVNPDWRKMAEQSGVSRGSDWLGKIEVQVTTLDSMAQRYGIPSFVKIDVEGFDDHVLRGMSFTPATLTFEFNRLLPAVAIRCLEAPVLSLGYEFNFVKGGTMECASPEWLSLQELTVQLDALVGEEDYGDVIARCQGRK